MTLKKQNIEALQGHIISWTATTLIGATVSWGSDPYLVEDEDEEKEVRDFLTSDGVEIEEVKEDNEDFKPALQRLNCSHEGAYTFVVYKAHKFNEEPMYFILDED